MNVSVTPIFPIEERSQPKERLEVRKPVDSKVLGLVLEKIRQTKGALLPTVSAPQIVTFLFETGKKKRKSKLRKSPLPRKAPIGLMPVDPEGWVNALMQFILYVPGFAESFSLAPHSLFPLQEFIDQYHHDLSEGKTHSLANSSRLMQFLMVKFPYFSLREIVEMLIHLLMPKWFIHQNIYDALKKPRTADLILVTSSLKKQLYADPGEYYDLDAFIEKRPDGMRVNYITYVKVGGCWYQCDNDRITQLRSDILVLPLQRAILAHYRQVTL